MALDALDAILAVAKGGLEGAREVQKERNEALEKRFKKIEKNDFELAKSAHDKAVKEHVKRKAEVNAIKSAGSAYDRAYYYYKDIMGDDDDLAREKVRAAAESGKLPEITDQMINEYVGDEPILFNDSDIDYSQARARSVVSDLFGLADDEPTGEASIQEQRKGVAAQIAKLQSSGKSMQPSEISTESMGDMPSYLRKELKAPKTRTRYDDKGNEYIEEFNADTGEWSKLEGMKPTSKDKLTAEQSKRNDFVDWFVTSEKGTQEEGLDMWYQLKFTDISQQSGAVVNKFQELMGRAQPQAAPDSEVTRLKERQAIKDMPEAIIMTEDEALANNLLYLERDPYGGKIENSDEYAMALAGYSRTLQKQLKTDYTEARNVAEMLMIPDAGELKRQENKGFFERTFGEGYTWDPKKMRSIDIGTLLKYKVKYPEKSYAFLAEGMLQLEDQRRNRGQ